MGQVFSSSSGFGPDQKKVIQEAFNFIDINLDGQIDQAEISNLMERLGVDVSEAEIEQRLNEFDKDKNGTINFKEFLVLMKEIVTDVHDERRLKEAFSLFDKDNNGYIDTAELDSMMSNLGETLSPEQVKEMLACADFDKDQKITFKEFQKFMMQPF